MAKRTTKPAHKNTPTSSQPKRDISTTPARKKKGNHQRWVTGTALALAAVAFVVYAPTLGHGFVLDDPLVTNLNTFVKNGFAGIADVFASSYRAGASVSTDSEYMYRPLSVAMFAAEWALSPENPGIHHFFSIFWYAVTGGLLFLVLHALLGSSHFWLSAGAALLFVVHPIHVEVVANIKSRDEIMCFLLLLASLWALLKATDTSSKVYSFWAGLAFLGALFAKEGAAPFLAIAPVALWFFRGKKAWMQTGWLLGAFVIWFAVRYAVMGSISYTPDFNDNQLVQATLTQRWATGLLVLAKYIRLLVFPFPLSSDYSFNQIPTVGLSNWVAIASLLVHVSVLGFSVSGLWRHIVQNNSTDKTNAILPFSAWAYLVSVALYSNILILIGTIMGERLVYQASAWFVLALVYVLWRRLKVGGTPEKQGIWSAHNSRLFAGIVGAVALVFAIMTVQRSLQWKDNYTLFSADATHAPQSFRIKQALGEELILRYVNPDTPPADTLNMLNKAYEAFSQSNAIRPTFNNLFGMGNVAYFQGNYRQAIERYEQSYALQPTSIVAKRLAITWRDWGRKEGQQNQDLATAASYLENALKYDSTDLNTLQDLGAVFGMSQQPDKATFYLEKALRLDPSNTTLRNNLALAYDQLGMSDKAAAIRKGQ